MALRAQPIADQDQQTVAAMVTEGVIDLLETIEIQVEQGSALASTRFDQPTTEAKRLSRRRRLGSLVNGSCLPTSLPDAAGAKSRVPPKRSLSIRDSADIESGAGSSAPGKHQNSVASAERPYNPR